VKWRALLIGVAAAACLPADGAADDARGRLPPLTPAEVKAILRHGPWPVRWRPDPSNRVSGKPEAIAFGERLFFGTSASTLRDTCREGTQTETAKQSYGYCLGFIYAVMIQLQNSKKACTLGPVDITPVIMEALDALAEVNGSGLQPEAWEVLEARLVQRFPPC